MKKQYERIAHAEAALNRADRSLTKLEQAIEKFAAAQKDFALLEGYLNSEERREDMRADEEGRLPDHLRRGVLSEDGIWNVLERRDALMDELAALTAGAQAGDCTDDE